MNIMFGIHGCKNRLNPRTIPFLRCPSPWIIPSCTNAICCPPGGTGKKGQSKRFIRFRPYVPPAVVEHDLKNILLKRPISPCLEVYAPTMPSLTSIFQRTTGVILTFYALSLSGSALFLPHGVETLVGIIQSLNLGRITVFIIKGLIGAPFAFHYFNGIRFVLWNLGKCLSLKEVYSTARLSWIAALAVTALFCLM